MVASKIVHPASGPENKLPEEGKTPTLGCSFSLGQLTGSREWREEAWGRNSAPFHPHTRMPRSGDSVTRGATPGPWHSEGRARAGGGCSVPTPGCGNWAGKGRS